MAHSRNFKDYTGMKVHRLTFLEFVGVAENGNSRWKVRCDCGEVFIVIASNVLHGGTKSCGCLRAENNRARHSAKSNKQDL